VTVRSTKVTSDSSLYNLRETGTSQHTVKANELCTNVQSTPGIMLIQNMYHTWGMRTKFIGNKQTNKQTDIQTLYFIY